MTGGPPIRLCGLENSGRSVSCTSPSEPIGLAVAVPSLSAPFSPHFRLLSPIPAAAGWSVTRSAVLYRCDAIVAAQIRSLVLRVVLRHAAEHGRIADLIPKAVGGQVERYDPITLAAEIDCDWRASQEGALIPSAWVQSAIGAHNRLNITPSGVKVASLDVADQGGGRNAFTGRHGILLQHLQSWSGKDRDILDSVVRAFALCDQGGYEALEYDSVGVGAGVRGDARIINEQRTAAGKAPIADGPFSGAAAVMDPKSEAIAGRANEDVFQNLKSQSWWLLRARFQATHRAIEAGKAEDPDALISIDPDLPELSSLVTELGQVSYKFNLAGKIVIDKAPDGARSPNLADSVMIAYSPASHASWAYVWSRL